MVIKPVMLPLRQNSLNIIYKYLFRIMLMEEEVKKSDENLASTITKLAVTSKDADAVLKTVIVMYHIVL